MLDKTKGHTLDEVLVRVPHKSRWARMPFGVRMTIGTAAVAATLMGAGVATATLALEPPERDAIGAAAPSATPTAGGPAVARARPPAPPAAAVGARGTSPAASRSADPTPHRTAPRRSAARRPAARTTATQGAGTRRPVPHRSTPHGSASRRPAVVRPGAGSGRPQGGGSAKPAPAGVRPTPTRVPSSVTPSASEQPSGGGSVIVTETLPVLFPTRWIEDHGMRRGTREVRAPGEPGIRTRTYRVTTVAGRETDRRLVSDGVTRKPVTRVVAVGTRRTPCRPGDRGCAPSDPPCPDRSDPAPSDPASSGPVPSSPAPSGPAPSGPVPSAQLLGEDVVTPTPRACADR